MLYVRSGRVGMGSRKCEHYLGILSTEILLLYYYIILLTPPAGNDGNNIIGDSRAVGFTGKRLPPHDFSSRLL